MEANYENAYWGIPDSIVNWCEPDYAHSNYIAEMFNTLSNLFTIIFSWFLFRHYSRNNIEKRFKLTALTLMVVGIGSTAFHGTLKYYFQLLDEIPMLFLTCSMTYLTLEMSNIRIKYPNLPLIGTLTCLLISIVHIYLQHAELFFSVFAILLAPALIFSGINYRSNEVFIATRLSASFLLIGFVLWQLDRSFCSSTQHLFFHAWWHIFTALSEIYWLNGMLYLRRDIIGQSTNLVMYGLWINFDSPKPEKIKSK